MNEIADRYAEALFALAIENGKLKTYKEEAESLLNVLEENPDLSVFFRAVKVTSEEKKKLITTVFGDAYDKDIVNFMKLLIDKGRIGYLADMLKAFISKANDELGIQVVNVFSARKLQEADLERIRAAVEKKLQKEAIIHNRIDESLIAGIKVVIGNNVTDVSMKHQIDELKNNLLKGGGQA